MQAANVVLDGIERPVFLLTKNFGSGTQIHGLATEHRRVPRDGNGRSLGTHRSIWRLPPVTNDIHPFHYEVSFSWLCCDLSQETGVWPEIHSAKSLLYTLIMNPPLNSTKHRS